MTDRSIYQLACRLGVVVDWIDAANRSQHVQPEVLRHILASLGYSADSDKDVKRSLDELSAPDAAYCPELITCNVDEFVMLPNQTTRKARLVFEDGRQRDVRLESADGKAMLEPIADAGYHKLQLDERVITLAVAPKRCFTLAELAPGAKLWGLAAQLYSLKRDADYGIGDTTSLDMLAKTAVAHGADAIAISPSHALFTARPDKFSPYSPSNRLFLNPLLVDPLAIGEPGRAGVGADRLSNEQSADKLIDWPRAAKRKMAVFKDVFEHFSTRSASDDELVRGFLDFRAEGGAALEDHARFEAIHAAMVARNPHNDGWLTWPDEFSSPDAPAVAAYAAEHEAEIAFHIFLQWLADRAFHNTQMAACESGMRIGLIADLAVGMEPGGSYAWSRQDAVLAKMTIGAPPDLFNSQGQDWGLTTLSPRGLAQRGFEPFISTLRAAMRNAGGVRIDHILGLNRLWVIPRGASPQEGAYLNYPLEDLLRLLRLESLRHRAIVIGEDLGTVPEGFRAKLADNGIAGMDVLWFSRDDDGFADPRQWRRNAVAMTSTHDLPTVAGWWCGADIQFRAENGLLPDRCQEDVARMSDRAKLSVAFAEANIAPPDEPTAPAACVDSAISFVAKSPAPLVLLPVEDLLGLEDQPNVPGTIDSHPNWRRRYPVASDEIFNAPRIAARADVLTLREKS